MKLGIDEERSGLDSEAVRKHAGLLQRCHVCIICSMVVFLAVAFRKFPFGLPADVMTEDEESLRMRTMYTMSLINVAVACVTYLLAWVAASKIVRIVQRFMDSLAADPKAKPDPSSAAAFLQYFTTMRIVRLGLIESSGLLAGAVCIIGGGGLTARHPTIWLNLIPVGIFFLYAIATFPTRGRMKDICIEEQVAHARRLAEQGA